MYPLLVWLLASLAVLAGLVGLRRLSLRRSGRFADFHWRGMIVLAAALGALPAILVASWPAQKYVPPDTAKVDDVLKRLDRKN